MDSSASEALFASTRPATPSTAASPDAASSPTASTSTSQPPETDPTPLASASSDQLEVKKEESFAKGLEAEVGQVMGSWKSFWGGVSKQVRPCLSLPSPSCSVGTAAFPPAPSRLRDPDA